MFIKREVQSCKYETENRKPRLESVYYYEYIEIPASVFVLPTLGNSITMKRFFLLITICFLFLSVHSQLSVKGSYTQLTNGSGVDNVILFSKIDNSSEIHFKSSNPAVIVRWFTFSNGQKKEIFNFSKLSSTQTYIDPKHHTGYIVSADGAEASFWVLDKSRESDLKNLYYENSDGQKFLLGDAMKPKTQQLAATNQTYEERATISSQEIEEIGCKITTTTAIRDSLNENQRPKETSLEGSAPLEIQFFSNPVGDVRNFLWQIYRDGNLIVTRTEQDHQYTFTETGKYKVRLQVSNDVSSASDSLDVSISESVLTIPKIFTPNGDGFNDEFRVAYTSIVEFNATIVNRWGRVVYKWTNPQTGWDGRIGGKDAPEGTYFYVIQAKGSDGKAYLRKGHINLLR